MKLSLKKTAILLTTVSWVTILGMAVTADELIRPKEVAQLAATAASAIPPTGTQAYEGYRLFLLNCAHCHGSDASGDEGPDLRGITKSNKRISSLIKNGIKGEMPKFGAKLTDANVQALIAFIRSLKDNENNPGSRSNIRPLLAAEQSVAPPPKFRFLSKYIK